MKIKKHLEEYSKKEWLDWLSDMLDFGIAYPEILGKSTAESIFNLQDLFSRYKISSKTYQEALLEKLIIILDSEKSSKDSLDYEKIVSALNSLKNIEITEFLVELFLSTRYQNDDRIECRMRSATLLVLSQAKLATSLRDRIYQISRDCLPKYVKDPFFCSSFIKFSYRQYIPIVDNFFENFVLILTTVERNDFKPLITTLIDKLEELEFHYKELFQNGFTKWQPKLYNTHVSDLLINDLKKFEFT